MHVIRHQDVTSDCDATGLRDFGEDHETLVECGIGQ